MRINHDYLFAQTTTGEMLGYIGTLLCKMTPQQLEALASKPNRRINKGQMPFMALRGAISKKLQEGDWKVAYSNGTLELDMSRYEQKAEQPKPETNNVPPHQQAEAEEAEAHGTQKEPEPEVKAEQTKKARSRTVLPEKGAYKIAKRPGTKSTEKDDEAKWAIWQHIWDCGTFEEFWAKAPAKGTRSTGKPITAASEMGWALKQGWIQPL